MCANSRNVNIPTPPHPMTGVASSMCVQWQDKHSCVASSMCASSRNVNIPTTPHPTLRRWPDVIVEKSKSSLKDQGHLRSVLQLLLEGPIFNFHDYGRKGIADWRSGAWPSCSLFRVVMRLRFGFLIKSFHSTCTSMFFGSDRFIQNECTPKNHEENSPLAT